jgi:hypothetical protein
MRRREFVSLLGGTAVVWPLVARPQQVERMPLVGFLHSQELADREHLVEAFRRGLSEAGYVEGQNVAVEYHSAENQPVRGCPRNVGYRKEIGRSRMAREGRD